jgi:hypothetical protein
MTAAAPDPQTRWQRLSEALDGLLDAEPSARNQLLADLTPSLRTSAIAALAAIEQRDDFEEIAADAAA